MKPVILELDFRFWGALHASRTAFERIDGIDFQNCWQLLFDKVGDGSR
jgi:hypothetical protein